MQKLILLIVATLAFVSGQYIFPSNATQLSFGTNLLALPPQLSITYARIGSLYYVYIPANTSAINITISMTSIVPASTRCTYVDLYASSEGYACDDSAPTESTGYQYYLCNYAQSSYIGYAGSSGYTARVPLQPGTYNGGYYQFKSLSFRSGGYIYLTAERDSSNTNDFNRTCPFTITINADSCSGNNAININTGTSSSSDTQCTTFTDITIPQVPAAPYNESFVNVTGSIVRRITVPAATGRVHMRFNASSYGYLSISNYQAAYNAAPGECSESSSSSNGVYYIDAICTGLTAGTAYVLYNPYDATTAWSGFMLLDADYCGAGVAGPYCNSTLLNMTSALAAPLNIQVAGDVYGYIDFDINSATTLFITTNYSIYVYFTRLGGFPTDDSEYYSLSTTSSVQSFTYIPLDFQTYTGSAPVSGRIYYFFDGSTSTTANITLSATQVPTTTTTTTSTGSATTTTGTGSTSTGSATTTTGTGSTGTGSTSTGSATTTTTSGSTTAPRMTTAHGTTGVAPAATTSSALAIIPSVLLLVALLF